MALSADITLPTGEIFTLNENELLAIDKWIKFKNSQKEYSNEIIKFREDNPDDISEEYFKVSVDPFEEDHWGSMLKGFLAAHGILGYRNMAISTYVYYTPIELNLPE